VVEEKEEVAVNTSGEVMGGTRGEGRRRGQRRRDVECSWRV